MKITGNEEFRLNVPACHEGVGDVVTLLEQGVLKIVGQPEFALEAESCGRKPTLDDFIAVFNEVMFRKFRGTEKNKRQFNARLKEGYSLTDMHKATKAAKRDDFHRGNRYKYLTPEYMLRSDILERFLNVDTSEEGRSMFDENN